MPRDLLDPPYTDPPEHEPGARAFGATIRARRMQAGVALRKCAQRMGISPTHLSYVEQGREPFFGDERERFEQAIGGER